MSEHQGLLTGEHFMLGDHAAAEGAVDHGVARARHGALAWRDLPRECGADGIDRNRLEPAKQHDRRVASAEIFETWREVGDPDGTTVPVIERRREYRGIGQVLLLAVRVVDQFDAERAGQVLFTAGALTVIVHEMLVRKCGL